jgi:hypothetical protein
MFSFRESKTRIGTRSGCLAAALLAAIGCGEEGSADELVVTEQDPVVFGADERRDYGAMSSGEKWRSLPVAIHVDALPGTPALTCSAGSCTLGTIAFTGTAELLLPLCDGVKYGGQLWATHGHCSAWLVAPDMVATAGHCFDTEHTCANARYIFGFTAAANGGSEVTTFPESEVYSCASIVALSLTGGSPTDDDYALVRLDRVVAGRTPIIVRYSGQATANLQVNMYGHPLALPKKIVRNAWLQDTSFSHRFYANGDIFKGNSGGPVLDLVTGVGEGIVVTQPAPFFEAVQGPMGPCAVYRTCANTGCNASAIYDRFTGAMRVTKVPGIPLHAALQSVVSISVL